VFYRFDQRSRFLRRGIAGDRLSRVARLVIGARQRNFLSDVAAFRMKDSRLLPAFTQRNPHQQAPESVPVLQLELAFGLPNEEAAKYGLNHVFRIDLLPQVLVQPTVRKADQPVGEPSEHLPRSIFVVRPKSVNHLVE